MTTLESFLGAPPWPRQLATAALFLLPALALTVQSGYSYGAALLLIGALCSLRRWPFAAQDRWTWGFAVAMGGMGVFWWLLANPQESLGGTWDRPSKFALGIACLLFVSPTVPRPRAQFWGLLAGCLGAGAVALWQVHVEGAPRASGFPSGKTNAIQWGNLALLLGTMLAVQAITLREHLGRAALALAGLAALMALNASVLSLSRGGWLALLLASPVGLYLLWRFDRRALWRMLGGAAVVLAVLGAANHAVLAERWNVMEKEMLVYDAEREAGNSVGQRLEHWRFAWEVGLEKPIFGWGMRGYLEEKEKRVAAGQYEPSIVEYIYTHNEPLDMFVKAGIVGVAWLLLFYAVPLCMFWPTRARVAAYARQGAEVRAQMLALRLGGVCIPLLYAGFGMTQVFFAHNSGIMFYLFMTMLTWAAVLGMDAQYAGGAGASSSSLPRRGPSSRQSRA